MALTGKGPLAIGGQPCQFERGPGPGLLRDQPVPLGPEKGTVQQGQDRAGVDPVTLLHHHIGDESATLETEGRLPGRLEPADEPVGDRIVVVPGHGADADGQGVVRLLRTEIAAPAADPQDRRAADHHCREQPQNHRSPHQAPPSTHRPSLPAREPTIRDRRSRVIYV